MLPFASPYSSRYHYLMFLVDLINTEEMGKVECYAGFVSCVVAILSQGLVIQVHYNDTLPDLSNVLQ